MAFFAQLDVSINKPKIIKNVGFIIFIALPKPDRFSMFLRLSQVDTLRASGFENCIAHSHFPE